MTGGESLFLTKLNKNTASVIIDQFFGDFKHQVHSEKIHNEHCSGGQKPEQNFVTE